MEIDSGPLMQRQVDASSGSTQLQPPSQQARPIVAPHWAPVPMQAHRLSWEGGRRLAPWAAAAPTAAGVGWRLRCVEAAPAVSLTRVCSSMSLGPAAGGAEGGERTQLTQTPNSIVGSVLHASASPSGLVQPSGKQKDQQERGCWPGGAVLRHRQTQAPQGTTDRARVAIHPRRRWM